MTESRFVQPSLKAPTRIAPTGPIVDVDVLVDGSALDSRIQVASARVENVVNEIPTAEVVLLESAMEGFLLANSGSCAIGKEIELKAGYEGSTSTIFKGVIVGHRLSVRGGGEECLTLQCADEALKLSVGRKSALYEEQADSEAFEQIVAGAGLSADAEATSLTHAQLVQYDVTDWEFLVARAEANGMLVCAEAGTVSLVSPKVSGSAAAKCTLGEDLQELDLEQDAGSLLTGVKAQGWDPRAQALVEATAGSPSEPGIGTQGATLATVVGAEGVVRTACRSEDELQAMANGRLLGSRLTRIRGSVTLDGTSALGPNTLLDLGGVGDVYSGKAFVAGVVHVVKEGEWKTSARLGLPEAWLRRRERLGSELPVPLPGAHGLTIGVVTQLAEDPDGEFRIKVKLPLLDPDGEGLWARMAHPQASSEWGTFFLPDVEDEVVVGFLGGDPRAPLVLGSLYSDAHKAPLDPTDDNYVKKIVSKEKLELSFDDEKLVFTVFTPAGNQLTLSDDEAAITIEDQNANKIVLNADGITIESAGDLVLKAAGDVKVEASANLELQAGAQFKAEGSSGANLESSAVTAIKGSLVTLN